MSRADDALAILNNPLFLTLMNDLEGAAINQIVSAKYDDHAARQAFAADIKAIRNLRSRIEAVSQEGQTVERKQAPA